MDANDIQWVRTSFISRALRVLGNMIPSPAAVNDAQRRLGRLTGSLPVDDSALITVPVAVQNVIDSRSTNPLVA